MNLWELLLIAVGLSMDAFAVSVCKGLGMSKLRPAHAGIIALFFGGFQGMMPLIGWFLGSHFQKYIVSIDHWVAFGLLVFIGGEMLAESLKKEESEEEDGDVIRIKQLFLLAIATSIDALAVGITFALLPGTNVVLSVILIGCVTFVLSYAGVGIGFKFGDKYEKKAQFTGGVILILLGLKILLEHMGVLPF